MDAARDRERASRDKTTEHIELGHNKSTDFNWPGFTCRVRRKQIATKQNTLFAVYHSIKSTIITHYQPTDKRNNSHLDKWRSKTKATSEMTAPSLARLTEAQKTRSYTERWNWHPFHFYWFISRSDANVIAADHIRSEFFSLFWILIYGFMWRRGRWRAFCTRASISLNSRQAQRVNSSSFLSPAVALWHSLAICRGDLDVHWSSYILFWLKQMKILLLRWDAATHINRFNVISINQ